MLGAPGPAAGGVKVGELHVVVLQPAGADEHQEPGRLVGRIPMGFMDWVPELKSRYGLKLIGEP